MNRIRFSVSSIILLTLGSCTSVFEDADPCSRIIETRIEESTKTHLGSGEQANAVLWTKGDEVCIIGSDSRTETVKIDDIYADTSLARFTVSESLDSPYTIVYPASVHASSYIVLPASQTLRKGSFADNAAVLAGRGENSVELKNLSAFIRFSTDSPVTGIVFEALGNEAVAGEFTLSDDCTELIPVSGSSSLHLTIPGTESVTGVTEMTVAVPSGWYDSGFTVKLRPMGEKQYRTSKAFKLGKTLKGGVIYTFPQIKLSECPLSAETFISSVSELQAFLNDGTGKGVMACDLDLSGKTITPCAEFSGSLDGHGYSLKNWNTATPLITKTTAGAVISNIVIDSSCSFTVPQSLKYFGFIVGNLYGKLTGCINNGNITCISPKDEVAAQHIGGALCGNTYPDALISDCINNGNVDITLYINTSSNQYTGGIVGIVNTPSTKLRLTRCVNNGKVSVRTNMGAQSSLKTTCVGGILAASGLNSGSSTQTVGFTKNYGSVTHCTNNGEVYECSPNGGTGGYHLVGGIIGGMEGSVTDCRNNGKVTFETSTEKNSSTPKVGGVAGLITMECRNNVNSGTVTASGIYGNASNTYALGVAGCYWTSIAGVAGQVGDGEVKTTTVLNSCTNYGEVTATSGMSLSAGSGNCMGGVCAFAFCDAVECHNHGHLSFSTNDYTSRLGGVIGQAYGEVKNCTNGKDLDYVFRGSGNTKEGTASVNIGGVVGQAITASVRECSSSGAVRVSLSQSSVQEVALNFGGIIGTAATASTEIAFCSNTGDISAEGDTALSSPSYIGGIVGYEKSGKVNISDCSSEGMINSSVSGVVSVGGVAAISDGNLKSCSSTGDITVSSCAAGSRAGGLAGRASVASGYTVSDLICSSRIKAEGCKGRTAAGIMFGAVTGNGTVSDTVVKGNISSDTKAVSGFISGEWADDSADLTIGRTSYPVSFLDASVNGTAAPSVPTVKAMVGDTQSIVPTAPSGGMTFAGYTSGSAPAPLHLRFTVETITLDVPDSSSAKLQYRTSGSDPWADYDLGSNPLGLSLISSSPSVAQISADGTIKALSGGDAVIMARGKDKCSCCSMKVTSVNKDVWIDSTDLDRIVASRFVKMPGNSVIQSIDLDSKGMFYYTQIFGVNRTAVARSYPDQDATTEYMRFWFHGHGTNTYIEEDGNDRYVWIGSFGSKQSDGSYQKEQIITRVLFQPGKAIYPWEEEDNYYMGPDNTTLTVAVDRENDQIGIYHGRTDASGRWVTVYRWSDAKALPLQSVTLKPVKFGGESVCPEYPEQTKTYTIKARMLTSLTPVARFQMPNLIQSMQGFDIHDGKCYISSGDGGEDDYRPGTAYLYITDFTGKVIVDCQPIKAISSVGKLKEAGITESGYMEAEGCKIRNGRLYLGFASKSLADDERRRANVFRYELRY